MSTSTATCLRCGGTFTQADPDDELCAACIQVVITDVEPRVTTYEEWRVTGTWDGQSLEKTFLPEQGYDEPEADARAFVARQARDPGWTDGPHLHKRTVTVTDWEEVEA